MNMTIKKIISVTLALAIIFLTIPMQTVRADETTELASSSNADLEALSDVSTSKSAFPEEQAAEFVVSEFHSQDETEATANTKDWQRGGERACNVIDFLTRVRSSYNASLMAFSGPARLAQYFPDTPVIDTFFGRQLNKPERYLYQQILSFYQGAASGKTTEDTVEFYLSENVEPFEGLTESQLDALYEPYAAEMYVYWMMASVAFMHDYPQYPVPYLNLLASPCYLWNPEAYEETGLFYGQITLLINFCYGGGVAEIRQWVSGIERVTSGLNFEGSRYERVCAIHDYLCDNAEYDYDEEINYARYTAYGALVLRKCVCGGYGNAFKLLCDLSGVPCEVISGYSNDNVSHAWNAVLMDDGNYYAVDTTWDDQGAVVYDDFLLVGSGSVPVNFEALAFSQSHIVDLNFSRENYSDSLTAPTLHSEAYPRPADEQDATLLDGAGLFEEFNNPSTYISTLKYAAGSFSFDRSIPSDIYNWTSTDYDKVYLSIPVALDLPENIIDGTVYMKVTLPDGMSFSETAVEPEKVFDHPMSGSAFQYWIENPVYLLYSEKYTRNQELFVEYDVSVGHSETVRYKSKIADLKVLSTVSSIHLLRERNKVLFEDIYPDTWNPSMFIADSASYHADLALFSAYLSDLMEGAFMDKAEKKAKSKVDLERRIRFAVQQFGLSKVQYSGSRTDGYEEESLCAVKKIVVNGNVKTVLIYAIQGSDTIKDWLGNLTYSGLRKYHEGFISAANANSATFSYYCQAVGVNRFQDSTRVLITGHSRGGAIANLIAAELMETYNRQRDVSRISHLYCYTFAAPNVKEINSSSSEMADGLDEYYAIFNLMNGEDVVPFVPGNPMEKHGHKLLFNIGYSVSTGWYTTPAESAIVCMRMLSVERLVKNAGQTTAVFLQALSNVLTDDLIENHGMQHYIDGIRANSFPYSYHAVKKYFDNQQRQTEAVSSITGNLQRAVDLISSKGNLIIRGLVSQIKDATVDRLKDAAIKLFIRCPVDVEISNGEGIICKIVHDDIAFCESDDIQIIIAGSNKELCYPVNAGLSVKIIGYDEGTMDLTAVTMDENGNSKSLYAFHDVPVIKDELVMTATANVDEAEENVHFLSAANETMNPGMILEGEQIETISVELTCEQPDVFVIGSGEYVKGDYILAIAEVSEDLPAFSGWYDTEGNQVSEKAVFGFVAESDISLEARFEDGADKPDEPVIIANGQCGDQLTWTLDSEGLLTISGDGSMWDFEWDENDEVNVPWTQWRDDIQKVIIREGTLSIGDWAFVACVNLKEISLPEGMREIGDVAFRGCYVLESVTIPDSVERIGDYAFHICQRLPNVRIPDSVLEIGEEAFRNCDGMTQINVSSGNPNYSSINGVLFSKDQSKLIRYPAGKSGKYTVPPSVQRLEENAFSASLSLTDVTIPLGVKVLPYSVFQACRNLLSVNIPSSVIKIDMDVFADCDKLQTIRYGGTEEWWGKIEISPSEKDRLAKAEIVFLGTDPEPDYTPEPTEPTEPTASASGVCGEKLTWELEKGVLTILGEGEMADYENFEPPWYDYADEITVLRISDRTTSIGRAAFGWLDNLADFTIPNSVTRIGDYAFLGCAAESVIIPGSVRSVGANAFAYCENLIGVEIWTGVEVLGVGAFLGCNALEDVLIPGSVMSVSNAAFRHCQSLASVTLADGVGAIEEWAFRECVNLRAIRIAGSVNRIESYAFEGDNALLDVYFEGVERQWEEISVTDGNVPLYTARIHFSQESIDSTVIQNVLIKEDALLIQIHCADGFSGAAYCGFYNTQGKMLFLEICALAEGNSQLTLSIERYHNLNAKVFVLNDNMTPQCASYSVSAL